MKPIDSDELTNRFSYHQLTFEQIDLCQAIRGKAKELAELVVDATPASREQSLALTAIEESVFWANAAIARRG